MARPRVYGERTTTAIRIPVELHYDLKEAADEMDVSVNHLILRACEDYLFDLTERRLADG